MGRSIDFFGTICVTSVKSYFGCGIQPAKSQNQCLDYTRWLKLPPLLSAQWQVQKKKKKMTADGR